MGLFSFIFTETIAFRKLLDPTIINVTGLDISKTYDFKFQLCAQQGNHMIIPGRGLNWINVFKIYAQANHRAIQVHYCEEIRIKRYLPSWVINHFISYVIYFIWINEFQLLIFF